MFAVGDELTTWRRIARVCGRAFRPRAEPRLVVYTAIIGGRDQLLDPTVITPGCRYVCYTDQPFVSETWEIRRVPSGDDSRRLSRFYKMMPHRLFDTEYSFWIDATFRVNVDVRRLIARHMTRASIAVFTHYERDCTYAHAEYRLSVGVDDPEAIRRQMQRYRTEGFPEHAGLWNGGALLRRHNAQIRALNEVWWREVESGSVRDELSFSYCTWKLGVPVASISGHTMKSAELQMTDHRLGRHRSEFDEAEWSRFDPPRALTSFPSDLDNLGLEFAGIYSDGWLDDSVFVGLQQPKMPAAFVLRGMVPLVSDPAFSTEVQVLLDGREIARETLALGDFELRTPMPPGVKRCYVRIHFSDGQVLPERLPRRATALARFIGFETDAEAVSEPDATPGVCPVAAQVVADPIDAACEASTD